MTCWKISQKPILTSSKIELVKGVVMLLMQLHFNAFTTIQNLLLWAALEISRIRQNEKIPEKTAKVKLKIN